MRRLAVAGLILALATAGGAVAQAPPPGTPQAYRPGLGDLMTMTVQPRHIKLGLAGQAQNWVYADYELHELEEAFQRASSVWPVWQGVPVAQMIGFNTEGPIAAIETAVKAHDEAKFTAAYQQLTEACDTCHQGAGRAWVVIQVPNASPYADQDLAPHH